MRRFTTFVVLSVIGSVLLTRFGNSLGVGTLPGDFSFQSNGRIWHIPLASCIVASVVLTLVWNLGRKLLRRR